MNENAPVEGQPAKPTRPARILVIDDEPSLSSMFSTFLEQEGFSVTTASDGWAGFVQAEGLRVDLVLTDVCMPGPEGTGIDAYNKLRRSNYLRHDLPIILMTALSPEQMQHIASKLDAHSRLIYKPVDLALLRRTIKEMLGR